ncbi:putative alpha-1,3-mannosyltransferase [Aspergillus saccharolyticus JOP 1030-1]|uniref:Alpha-1,3-mannosyltransferase n=1 Tax=Aspergillus saccharolyticus JOP 1030-1 TaxID=1450539 RepID=A0A318ZRV9_9EURO|nr:hypothetical protein BP01DRAFT_396518 [Aspergillus saccharolyticus JOP 1030-1]PYH49817.1 hypothetical protein BP01DRAFT_396518 [Aspergillus saccharolyticus JOP 1030-1]
MYTFSSRLSNASRRSSTLFRAVVLKRAARDWAPATGTRPQQPLSVPYAHTPVSKEAADSETLAGDLRELFSLLSDSSHTEELTRPIQGTGEAKLRELGFRTRAFSRLFQSWERLHLVEAGEQMLVRSDLLQTLQRTPHVASQLHLDPVELTHRYEAARAVVSHLSRQLFDWSWPYFGDLLGLHAQYWAPSRGIVFTAGNAQAPYLLTSIRSLRAIGCELPIEVMYLGDEDLDEDFREALEGLPGVVTRDLRAMISDAGWTLRGWAAKPFAILLASFRETVFIDADSLFVQNPVALFAEPRYQQHGALFFRDRLLMPGSRKEWIREVLPEPVSRQVRRHNRMWTGQSIHMQESGVVVVDKWRHFVALLLVTRMNGPDREGNEAEGRRGVYDMVYGDKETFWLGWELAGDTEYAFHEGAAAVMGPVQSSTSVSRVVQDNATSADNPPTATLTAPLQICAPQILHLGVDGRPLWFNGWLLRNKYATKQEYGTFEGFITEPPDAHDDGSWKLQQNNVCCMSADRVTGFTDAEREVLGRMVEIAREVGGGRS